MWRDTTITIKVAIDGEVPIELTKTYERLHKTTPHVGIEDMASVFRVHAGGMAEREKPKNKRWAGMVKDIKRSEVS